MTMNIQHKSSADTETARLNALKAYDIMDTSPELAFDRITQLTQRVFDCFNCVVSFVDENRQWYKSNSRNRDELKERPRQESFCHYAIAGNEVLVIEDARKDPVFKDLPAVKDIQDLRLRFYAGAPLTTPDGHNIGTLCIVDKEPRQFSIDDKEILRDFADLVMAELELRRQRRQALSQVAFRKAREESLRQTRARHLAIIENVPVGLMTVDDTGRIKRLNPHARKMFGCTTSQVRGKNAGALLATPDSESHKRKLRSYVKTRDPSIFNGDEEEVTAVRQDGSVFPMKLIVTPLAVRDGELFTYVMEDISAQKDAERIKNEFISTVSHELRTPLTSIKGSLGLLIGRYADDIPQKACRMIEIAYQNSDRLVRLINDILDIEKIEAGKVSYKFSEVELSAILSDSVESNDGFADQSGVEVIVEENLPDVKLSADPDRMMQVMTNLLSNAIKFSPENGKVSVTASRSGDAVRISVTDQGPGIDEEFRDKLFDKFTQADTSDQRQKAGTGLGLSICKAIVEDHGGRIGFDTKPGKGTTFYFELPVMNDTDRMAAFSDQPIREEEIGKPRILVCEDNADVARLLSILMQKAGICSDLASNADEARAMLRARHYDAMTLDLGLPGEDGLALVRDLRRHEETKTLPVVVVSAQAASHEKRAEFKDLNVVSWLQKPIDQRELRRALNYALNQAPSARAQILHVEDDDSVLNVVTELIGEKADVTPAHRLKKARELVRTRDFDLIILDLFMPDGSGRDLLAAIHDSRNRSTPVLVFSIEEPDAETAKSIHGSFLKSRVSNDQLLEAIRARI